MRIAIVVQRYGPEIVGGAESLARQLAERLHADLGWDVDVYTTTARDYVTWANEYDPGEEVFNGVRVLRFDSRIRRTLLFSLYERFTRPWLLSLQRWSVTWPLALLCEWIWIVLQGPYAPALVRALVKNQDHYRKVLFFTYLYYPTLAGLPRLSSRAILVPTAHDEHPFHFLAVTRMLRAAPVILVNTHAELELVRPRLDGAATALEIGGVGVDEAIGRDWTGPEGQCAFALYLGRIGAGKRVDRLIDWFVAYVAAHPGVPVRLRLAGHLEHRFLLPTHPSIEYLGRVSDDEKARLISGATVLVNPSPHESLSLIVVEAIAAGVPVLVNTDCPALRAFTEEVPTVGGFTDYASFDRELSRVLATDWRAPAFAEALARAQLWARCRFSWPRVLSVYQRHVLGDSAVPAPSADAAGEGRRAPSG